MNDLIKAFMMFIIITAATAAWAIDVPEKNERQPEQKSIDGSKSTPMQPDGKWHVHDPDRPQPPVVEPEYDGKPVPAPKGAKIIFDGTNLDNLVNKDWKIKDGVMIAAKGSQKSKEAFGDVHLHLEWRVSPKSVKGWGQKQGNSGVLMMEKYEIQILNCWANRTYPDGMTGALYGQHPPLANACRKTGEWNSYDIKFKAPVFKNNKLVKPAYASIYLNNVLIQDNAAFTGATIWRKLPKYKPHEPKAPFSLQYHANPVEFRNIWAVPKE
ncbi:DUF1080 domain-containing protein [Verrucomicrobiota bacterium]